MKPTTPAYGYIRTSSAANVGEDKDSEPRQVAAIESWAKRNGFRIVDWYRDPAVSGSDHITDRPGFSDLLTAIACDGVRVVIVETPDRFARDLMVLLVGHEHLRSLGVELIPASAPEYFREQTPTAVLIRQLLGAVAEFQKEQLVAQLRAARHRKQQRTGRKVSGRKSYAEMFPEMVAEAKRMRKRKLSLVTISHALAENGWVNGNGNPYAPAAVRAMILGK